MNREQPEPASQTVEEIARDRASRGLSDCPVCRYHLDGLPAAHRCPECHFPYDEHTRVWRPRSFVGWAWPLLLFMVPLWPMSVLAAMHHTLFSRQFAASALLLAIHTFAIWAVYTWYRAGPFISVTPEGVRYRTNGPRVYVVEWSDIARGWRKPLGLGWLRPIPGQISENLPYRVRVSLATITLRREEVASFQSTLEDGLQRYGRSS